MKNQYPKLNTKHEVIINLTVLSLLCILIILDYIFTN